MTQSKECKAITELLKEIERLDRALSHMQRDILFTMAKRDGLMACMKQLTKELR